MNNETNKDENQFSRVTISQYPLPHGGVKEVANFFDKDGNPCKEGMAHTIQILEYDENDVCVFSIIANGKH